MLSGSDGIAVRCIHYDDSIHCGCGNVDIVHSNTSATDNFEIRSRLQNIGGYFSFAANDQAFTVLKSCDKFILRESRPFFANQASITQGLQATVAYVICHEYFHTGNSGDLILPPSSIILLNVLATKSPVW